MTTLRVGFAQRDITPARGLPLGGYGSRVAAADGALDPLWCRAVIFDDGSTPLALVVLDVVYVFGAWVAAVRTRVAEGLGLDPDRVMIAATHTHAGPGVFRSTMMPDEHLAAYEHELGDHVMTSLAGAVRAAEPAQLRCGSAPATGICLNRRDPGLPVDQTVRVFCACRPSGHLIGVVANFACHPTVLSAANHSYSADLFGAAAADAARDLGVPVVLTNGAAGDVSTRFTRCEQTYAEVGRLGHALAVAIRAAVDAAVPVRRGTLGAAASTVPVRWRALPTPADAATQLQSAIDALQDVVAHHSDPAAIRLAQSRVEGAQAELWLASQGGWDALFGPRPPLAALQALRCGDMTIVGAPGELFSSAGRWLHDRLGKPAFVIGYANDYLGYFIPEADAQAGGYESLVAMVHPACEVALRAGLLDVARRLG